jgi:7-dehydrocholesterol reductase
MVATHYDCILSAPLELLWNGKILLWDLCQLIPLPTWQAAVILLSWYTFQVLLYVYLPGPSGTGQNTPAGYRLSYHVNGLRAYVVSHLMYFLMVFLGLIPATIVYDHWPSLLVMANIFGYCLAIFAYYKAQFFPTHREDLKVSGSLIYDFFMGIELNPRIGEFDFKLFFNGRPGIIGWSITNLSFMAAQYHSFGTISNSMIIVVLLQAMYIIDFFYHENWYLCTIDIAHDHFGWYLAWGDVVWLPFNYTLQALYLTYHPYVLSTTEFMIIIAIGLMGYCIFRMANNQKKNFRDNHKDPIFGYPPTFIEATYRTSDGRIHQSNLLTSGMWGVARHFNYFGDLCLSFAFCGACGHEHIFPYFYLMFMTILLLGRVERDQYRLQEKYGSKWEEYCAKVPWKILPYVY